MLRAVIFDMDGVIVDSERYQFEAFRQLFLPYGIRLTKDSFDWVGKTSQENIEAVLDRYALNKDPVKLVALRRKTYTQLIKDHIRPMAGVLPLITKLRKNGYRLALASSSIRAHINMILERLNVLEDFEVIVSGDMIIHGKPNPEIFLRTIKELKLLPTECVVIEDSQRGVEAAYHAGIKCIVVPNEYTLHQDFSKATKIIVSLRELALESLTQW